MPSMWYRFGFPPEWCSATMPEYRSSNGGESEDHARGKRLLAQAALDLGWRVAFELKMPGRQGDVVIVKGDRAAQLEMVVGGSVGGYDARAFPVYWFAFRSSVRGQRVYQIPQDDARPVLESVLLKARPYRQPLPMNEWVFTRDYLNFFNNVIVENIPTECLARVRRFFNKAIRDISCRELAAAFLLQMDARAQRQLFGRCFQQSWLARISVECHAARTGFNMGAGI